MAADRKFSAPERPALIDQLHARLGGTLRATIDGRVLDVTPELTIAPLRDTGKVYLNEAYQLGVISDGADHLAEQFRLVLLGLAATEVAS